MFLIAKQIWVWVFALFLCAASPALALISLKSPQDSDVVLAIFTPWGAVGAALESSDLIEAHPQHAPFGRLISIDGPGDIDRLYAMGSLLVLDGDKILALCAT